jgi:hypothetical protein
MARLLVVCCVVGLCTFAVTRGWSIVRFAQAEAGVAAREVGVGAIRPWIAAPGLTGTALHASLNNMTEDTQRRSANLTELLAVRPLAASEWLSLAGMRLVTGQPYAEIVAALAMSSVTGPNEGAVMVQRAIFGLLQWEALPPEARQRTVDDLAGAIRGSVVGDSAMTVAKNLLRAKSPEVRSEIAGLLQADRVPMTDLVRMGL